MKWLADILKPLFDFLKELCDCPWKKTVMLFFTMFLLLVITGGIIYVNTLKYAIPHDNPKYVVEKPESNLPEIEYREKTLFNNKAQETK